ncbi:PA14 domain-containing protein [Deinococcus sp.]|uniref:PA14 domain-containing protein n=1 Tax=Deinococcus sp. TaxID=47478 RepID=UPI0026004072|nr:PA14 domain-containing protein [Deinococcus sp.]
MGLGLLLSACGAADQTQADQRQSAPAPLESEALSSAGLNGEYFGTIDLSGPAKRRTDPTVNFDWGDGSPLSGIRNDQFSARYVGEVRAPTSGKYTFYVTADDGMRLDVGGKRLIDDFTDHPATTRSGQIRLVAGKRAKINLEYYENGGQASLKLEWSGPGIARQVVPASALSSSSSPGPSSPDATGRTFWVAPGGNDGGPGSEASPWATINKASQTLTPGDTVLVKDGTYTGVYIASSGKPGKPITFKAAPGAKPNIFITEIGSAGFLLQGASYIDIEGFNLDYQVPGAENANGERWEPGIAITSLNDRGPGRIDSHHVRIIGNRVHGFPGGGIGSGQADYVTIEGNTIWETAFYSKYDTSAISLYQSRNVDQAAGYHHIIRANTVFKNENRVPGTGIGNTTITDGNCIIIDDGRNTQKFQGDKATYPAFTGATLVENNICADNGGRGVNVFSSDNVLIRNNTFYKNGRTPDLDGEISVAAASNVRVVNNIIVPRDGQRATSLYDGNRQDLQVSNVTFERNLYFNSDKLANRVPSDIVADPQFVSPGNDVNTADFRLKSGSPAIDRALSADAPAYDVGGLSRPVGAGPDIGAWEAR